MSWPGRSFSGDRPANCDHFRCFTLRVENGGFSGSTGNSTVGLEKPFQSLCRLVPAERVFQRLGPPTLLPRILWTNARFDQDSNGMRFSLN